MREDGTDESGHGPAGLPPGMKRWWGGSLDFSSPRASVDESGDWSEDEDTTVYSGEGEQDVKMEY
ncbi:hypothetical protein Tdes44962_MAKER07855 [Teratosphaeria destructans]|uniref:Uncharacterized protein n=1 Tax=Teratosphaeria destructans TaxID=418781 RepID=A0A9W7SY82_9PEZI|nr:hypothetical protein Tdes44962_MAKER07855 [Teratosphaeria destructans]